MIHDQGGTGFKGFKGEDLPSEGTDMGLNDAYTVRIDPVLMSHPLEPDKNAIYSSVPISGGPAHWVLKVSADAWTLKIDKKALEGNPAFLLAVKGMKVSIIKGVNPDKDEAVTIAPSMIPITESPEGLYIFNLRQFKVFAPLTIEFRPSTFISSPEFIHISSESESLHDAAVYIVTYEDYDSSDIVAVTLSRELAENCINARMAKWIQQGALSRNNFGIERWVVNTDSDDNKIELIDVPKIEYKTAYTANRFAKGRYSVDAEEGVAVLAGTTETFSNGKWVSFVSEEHAMQLLLGSISGSKQDSGGAAS